MKKTLAVILAALLLFLAIPTAQAQNAEAGVSGQCEDKDGHSGNDDVRAGTDNGNPYVDLPDVIDLQYWTGADPLGTEDGQGEAVAAVVALAGPPFDPPTNMCTSSDDEERDYLEVHVIAEGNGFQICYDGDKGGTPTGPCETNPDDNERSLPAP